MEKNPWFSFPPSTHCKLLLPVLLLPLRESYTEQWVLHFVWKWCGNIPSCDAFLVWLLHSLFYSQTCYCPAILCYSRLIVWFQSKETILMCTVYMIFTAKLSYSSWTYRFQQRAEVCCLSFTLILIHMINCWSPNTCLPVPSFSYLCSCGVIIYCL